MSFTAPSNGSHTLMHLIQTFMVEILGHIRTNLPEGAEVLTRGRTMLKGALLDPNTSATTKHWTEFVVQLAMQQFEDDMWPHIDVSLTLGEQSTSFDVHPARTAAEHARTIVDHLTSLREGSS